MAKKVVFRRDATGLIREISTFDALVIVFSFVVGGGIMFLSVQALAPGYFPGANLTGSYVGGLLMILPIFVIYTVLAKAMPRSGGDYVFNSRIIGPGWAFLASWGIWLSTLLFIGVLAYQTVEFLSLAVFQYGQATWNLDIIFKALTIFTPVTNTILAVAAVLILGMFVIIGTRLSAWVMRILFILPLIGTGVMIWLFATHSGIDMWWAWNTMFGWGADGYGAYFDIFQTATRWGWLVNSAFSSSSTVWDTFGAMFIAIFAFSGVESITIVSGEVRNPQRTLWVAILLGTLLIATFYGLILYPMQQNFGSFISAYAYLTSDPFVLLNTWSYGYFGPLSELSGSTLQYWLQSMVVIPPNVPLFASPLAGLNLLSVGLLIVGALWLLNYIIPALFTFSRYVFAWSFDRIFPAKISSLNERTNTPIYAVGISLLVAIMGAVMSYFSIFQAALDTIFLGIVAYALVVFSGLLFSRRRKDLAETTYNPKIGRVPIVLIAGLVSFVALIPLIIAGFTAFEISSAILIIVAYTIGVSIYLVMRRRSIKRGIDLGAIFKEIPPE